eukprot:403744-Prymnesium_polylepis.2
MPASRMHGSCGAFWLAFVRVILLRWAMRVVRGPRAAGVRGGSGRGGRKERRRATRCRCVAHIAAGCHGACTTCTRADSWGTDDLTSAHRAS